MIVWRLETERTRIGVFCCGAAEYVAGCEQGFEDACDPYQNPTPFKDAVLRWNHDIKFPGRNNSNGYPPGYRFGFRSIKQYREWFWTKGARKALANWRNKSKDRIVLRKYKINTLHVIMGEYQLLFRRGMAELIETREVCT